MLPGQENTSYESVLLHWVRLLIHQRRKIMVPCSTLYLSFVRMHNFPIEPTPDTLSFCACATTLILCLSILTSQAFANNWSPTFLPFERPGSLCYAKEPSLAASISGVSPPNERELCPWTTCITLSLTTPTHTLMMTSCLSLSSSLASLRSCVWVSW